MPTLNPRINVTLSPTLYDLISRLAAMERVSRSNVLRELLEASAPSLARALSIMEAASEAKPEMLRQMASAMEVGVSKVEGWTDGFLTSFEAQQTDLVEQAQAIQGRRPGRRPKAAGSAPAATAAGINPPFSNRGVKSPQTREKQGKPLRSSKAAK